MRYQSIIVVLRYLTQRETSCDFDTDNLLARELAPYPTSMFGVDGHYEVKTKSTALKLIYRTALLRGTLMQHILMVMLFGR